MSETEYILTILKSLYMIPLKVNRQFHVVDFPLQTSYPGFHGEHLFHQIKYHVVVRLILRWDRVVPLSTTIIYTTTVEFKIIYFMESF